MANNCVISHNDFLTKTHRRSLARPRSPRTAATTQRPYETFTKKDLSYTRKFDPKSNHDSEIVTIHRPNPTVVGGTVPTPPAPPKKPTLDAHHPKDTRHPDKNLPTARPPSPLGGLDCGDTHTPTPTARLPSLRQGFALEARAGGSPPKAGDPSLLERAPGLTPSIAGSRSKRALAGLPLGDHSQPERAPGLARLAPRGRRPA